MDAQETELVRRGRQVENDEVLLQGRWPAFARLCSIEEDKTQSAVPYWFEQAYPQIQQSLLRKLALACKLNSTRYRRLDGAETEDTNAALVRAYALQFETIAAFGELFSNNHPFWKKVQSFEADYILAFHRRQSFRNNKRPICELTHELATSMATARQAALKTCVVGLGYLADDARVESALVKSIDFYARARSWLDEILSWKYDLVTRSPTYLLASIANSDSDLFETARSSQNPSILIPSVYGGGVQKALLRALRDAQTSAAALPENAHATWWCVLVNRLVVRVRTARDMFKRPSRAAI